ncbi:LexA family transcriptional regulator [Tatumella sp. JGM118]|uniref:LexA family protein n=1 Tax=Tatumella sp. JGM118 TaxID=2799796 RepID=UPI002012B8E8|nr:LexA family transcriptional regulator [Tatumella sp. JGM118]
MNIDNIPSIFESRRLRLKKLVDDFETQRAFAEKAGLDTTVVSRMLYPVGKPNRRNIGEKAAREIEKALNLPIGWMNGYDHNHNSEQETSVSWSSSKRYPVIDSGQAANWPLSREDSMHQHQEQWLESDAQITGDGFWLRIEDESMTSPSGVSIPEGTYVLFDTGREARNGNLVAIRISDDTAVTFKKLILDGRKKYLKALNPIWPSISEIEGEYRVVGVAVETKMKLL